MNQKLEAQFLEFVRELSALQPLKKGYQANKTYDQIIERARNLWQRLLDSGYGK